MTLICPYWIPDEFPPRTVILRLLAGVGVALFVLTMTPRSAAQDTTGTVKDGYAIHQSIDLGGRIVDYSGSGPMYDTLVNLQSGPRILSQALEMHAVGKIKYPFFDSLMANSAGYGGDPDNFTMLRMSKGKLYDFQGMFRRDRQYFDYNLFDNPLIPNGITSNGYTFPQVQSSPHLFNTVRRMTDTNLTLFPISKVSLRVGYSQNIMQGPTGSSLHMGTEALLLQNWRNSTDSWLGAVDWKPFSKTMITYEEYVTHYKGNTSWQLSGLNMQLANGAPVTIGFDNTSVPSCTGAAIVSSSTSPPTANATCNGYLQYSRYEPTRTLFPTEEFRFQSSNIKNVQMNGRVRYTGANMNLPDYNEYFNGIETRTKLRAATTTGYSTAKRVNVSADYGIVWQVAKKLSLSDQYDFWDFRQPAFNYLSEVDQSGSSMLTAPGAPQAPAVTTANAFLGQKTETNTLTAAWLASSRATISLGYRYRSRDIARSSTAVTDALPNGTAYTLGIHENGGILGLALRPTSQWRINGSIEASYANRTYTQISPRALQRYNFRATYKPKDWATISGAFNDLERRNNVQYVNHLDHSRIVSLGASLMPSEHYGLELSYGYMDIFSRTNLCYAATPAPTDAVPVPVGTGCGTNTYLGNGYYDAPTQYGAIGITLAPVKQFRSAVGYRMSAVSGNTDTLNPRQVPGSLQSEYQSPYANVAWTLHPGWIWKAEWNYYGYGEGGPVGPTLPRAFRGNLYTISMHYEF
ncbi:hypothetical protein [Pseudacidobacterium ailaaui]|jgi:hypothetical protein|uniref:hypothetical protein n=1 Tax=Pseudacidobacterium ailaaui TaxID=1382359 RepID=UPI00047E4D0E|nr:hypothetical protein [Pseudacidobacterium ailaaui]